MRRWSTRRRRTPRQVVQNLWEAGVRPWPTRSDKRATERQRALGTPALGTGPATPRCSRGAQSAHRWFKPEERPMSDPTKKGPQPPQPRQQQSMPGRTDEMTPRPDHGEDSYRGSGKLKEKVALITGADSGIGRAVAIAFAREGADILISYLDEEEDA